MLHPDYQVHAETGVSDGFDEYLRSIRRGAGLANPGSWGAGRGNASLRIRAQSNAT